MFGLIPRLFSEQFSSQLARGPRCRHLKPTFPKTFACRPERSALHSRLSQGVNVAGSSSSHRSSSSGCIHCQAEISLGLGEGS